MRRYSSKIDRFSAAALMDGEAKLKVKNRVSVWEQVHLLPPLCFQGVDVYVLDESSHMYTGSFKALTALECISDCLKKGIQEICFTSGANTGSALAAYGNRMGIYTHFFIPASNIWKLDARYVESPLSNVYAVENAARTKETCERFAQETGIPLMPKPEHRMKAAQTRGFFIASLIHKGPKPNWFAQLVCAGFGPIGIYDFLLTQRRADRSFSIPKFLGVQQSGNCSLIKYLQSKRPKLKVIGCNHSEQLIEETMYDKHPETYNTFELMERVLSISCGAMVVISENKLVKELITPNTRNPIRKHLQHNGVALATTIRNGKALEIVQKAGLLAIAGVIEAIRAGLIMQGQAVLCSFGGGATVGTFQSLPEGYTVPLSGPFEISRESDRCYE